MLEAKIMEVLNAFRKYSWKTKLKYLTWMYKSWNWITFLVNVIKAAVFAFVLLVLWVYLSLEIKLDPRSAEIECPRFIKKGKKLLKETITVVIFL